VQAFLRSGEPTDGPLPRHVYLGWQLRRQICSWLSQLA